MYGIFDFAFEGNPDSIRFVTFSTPMSASDPKTLMHEVKFYIGKHPETGQNGVILMERDISNGDTFSKIEPRSNSIQYFVMAKNVAQLKFRYYQMKKIPLNELDRLNKKPLKFFGEWNECSEVSASRINDVKIFLRLVFYSTS